ncbi:MAG: metal-dependent transcriptional regulator [Atopostipes suicloacalis]|nr:metal-dependent transcriptional regulator [Atopostipes suicloacalis]MDN6730752.1 metal-dependent transcriptional regulator [Atopostipes suicloacalis]
MKISPSKEDYLKAIHSLNGAYTNVSNKNIAELLSVSAASVSEMNTRLVKEKLISHIPYKGVKLTDEGIKSAHLLIRKHRLWEVFLYEILDFQWNEVHAEADRLEHASSDLLIERLNIFLDQPKYDPHGGLIPNADGTVDEEDIPLHNLAELPVLKSFRIKEVADDKELLTYLYENNIVLNHSYQLLDKDSFDGAVTILDQEDNRKLTISGKAVNHIKVVLLDSLTD